MKCNRGEQPVSYRIMGAGLSLALILIAMAWTSLPVTAREQLPKETRAMAILNHTPYGQAIVKWDTNNKSLNVRVVLTGLQTKSRHPAHIHAGDCSMDGKIVYTLNDLVADAAGNAVSNTTIKNVNNGIPATGWYINVHAGPTTGTTAEALPITCGNIYNSQNKNTVVATLGESKAANQTAGGRAELTLKGNTLTVTTRMYRLVPGSVHVAHIHAGNCENQIPGTVLYPLTTLTADAQGAATSVTVIRHVQTIPATGWHINIHFGTDLSTQSGYDPIACGNVMQAQG